MRQQWIVFGRGRIGVFGGFGRESRSEKCLASRVDNSSLPTGK